MKHNTVLELTSALTPLDPNRCNLRRDWHIVCPLIKPLVKIQGNIIIIQIINLAHTSKMLRIRIITQDADQFFNNFSISLQTFFTTLPVTMF